MNNKLLTVFRWLVGLLFIFSGLIKANDPLGLSYKMQEFFEAWQWKGFHDYSLAMSIVMNILEVVTGVALIVGWQLKRVLWVLLLLIVFFTFLTSYVLFSGKIHACGCFGDCVPLTPIQTFSKDIALLVMIVLLLLNVKKLQSFTAQRTALSIVMVALSSVGWLQWYALKSLPPIDCLPYARGKNILEGMKPPADAKPAITKMVFKYKKDGKLVEFQDSVPTIVTEDSTYEYVDRVDKVIQEGSGLPKIVDFSLVTMNGNDTTMALLQNGGKYVMLFVKDFSTLEKWQKDFEKVKEIIKQKNIRFFMVTADAEKAAATFTDITILKCDATVIKTAARVNPTYLFMDGATILDKASYVHTNKIDFWLNSTTFTSKP